MDAPTFPLKRARKLDPLDEARWQDEIARAKAGSLGRITCKAAAYYLNMHEWTLRQLVRNGVGPVPERNQAKPGTTATNQRMYFTLAALDEYRSASEGDLITRGHRRDALAMRKEAARIQALLDVQAARDQLAKLEARAKRIGAMTFDSLMEAADLHPWALDEQGRILGHDLAMDEAVAVDDVLLAPLMEALQEPWVSTSARDPYEAAALHLLDLARRELEQSRDRQSTDEHEGNTAPAQGAFRDGGRI